MGLLFSDTKRRLLLMQLLLAVVLSNLKPVFSKVLFGAGWTPVQLYFVVLLVMTIVLLAHEVIALERGERWGMTKEDIFGAVLAAVIGGVIGPLMFFTALQDVTASESILLTSLVPLFVVIFAVAFLGEEFTGQMVLGGLFLMGGLVALLWNDLLAFELRPGALLLLGSSIISALTTIIHKRYVKHRHLDSVITVKTVLSLVCVGLWLLNSEPEGLTFLADPQNVWLVLAMPLVSFLLPFFLFFRALKKTKAVDAGIMAAMGRVIGIVVASTLLGETLGLEHLLSLCLIVVGILFINVPLTKWHVVPSRLLEIGPLRK